MLSEQENNLLKAYNIVYSSCPFDDIKQSWVSIDDMLTALHADGLTKIEECSGLLVAKPKSSVGWRPLAGKVDMSDDEINKLRINGGIV